MKYLVTGGAGFIGSAFIEKVTKHGHTVLSLDNYSTGTKNNHIDHSNVAYLSHDLVLDDKEVLNTAVANSDYVVHLASAVGVKLIMEKPLESMHSMLIGTENVRNACVKNDKPILFTSTSEVYGKSDNVPFYEDDDVCYGPTKNYRWSYAYAKAVDEMMLLTHSKTSVVRLFNTVGPRQSDHYGMVLPRFIGAALRGDSLTVYGHGFQTRCFCHVSDVVDALYKITQTDKCYGEILNIGSESEISILDLAKKVIAQTNSTSSIAITPYSKVYPKGFEEMFRRVPSIQKARDLLGWKPITPLEVTISDILRYLGGN